MYDVFCDCDDCKQRIALGDSTFQTNDEEKQGLDKGVGAVNTLVSEVKTPRNPTQERSPLVEYFWELVCRVIGHDYDEDTQGISSRSELSLYPIFSCKRCRHVLPIMRIR